MGIASSIGGFFVEIGAKVDNASFEKGEKKVANLGTSLKSLIGDVTKITTALVGMSTVAGTVETKNLKLAQSIGISAEKLDQWKVSAGIAGTNADALVSSMDSIEQKMRGLKTGNVDMNLAKNLGFMGIGYSQFAEMDADERMKTVLESARGMQDQEKASKLVADILGEAGKDYYSYLQLSGKSIDEQLKQSKKLIFTDENSKREAMIFNAEIKGLFETTKSLGTYISSKIAGQLTPIVSKIKDLIAQNKELIKSGITGFVETLGSAFNNAINIFSRVAPIVGRLVNQFGGLDKIIAKLGIGIAGLKLAKLSGGVLSVVQNIGLLKTALAGLGLGAIFMLVEDLMTYLENPSGEYSAIGYIIENMDLIKEKFKDLLPNVNFDSVIDSFKNLGTAFGDLLKKFTGKNTVSEALFSIAEAVGKFLSAGIEQSIKTLQNLANIMTSLLTGNWGQLGKDIKKFFVDYAEGIKNIFSANDVKDEQGLRVGNEAGTFQQIMGAFAHPIQNFKIANWNDKLADLVNKKAGKEIWGGNAFTGRTAKAGSGWSSEKLNWSNLDRKTQKELMELFKNDEVSPQTFKNFINTETIPKINDGIVSPNGHITQVAPDDWVFAMKDIGNIASAFLPKNYGNMNNSMNAPITINQSFTFNGNTKDFAPAIKQQAYAGTNEAILRSFQNSQRILQQMSGTR